MRLSAGTRLGPYEILSPIGAGGMGEVYRARDMRLDRTVAIKICNQQFSDRFAREAHAVATLNHPHICTLHDIGQYEGVDFLVMEYLEGETLQARLTRAPLEPVDVLRYGIHIAEALAHAHRHGICHRDLKPGNVMVVKSGAKLLDFGLAKLHEIEPASEAGAFPSMLPTVAKDLTAKGTILGTFQYMAPEQLEGKPADTRSDIWAFGAVLYEMATMRKAFSGSSQASLIAAILTAQPQPISAQNVALPALDHIVRKCLAKDPEERWQSAADIKSQLEWIAQGGQQPQEGKAVPLCRRERFVWMAATAVLLAALSVLSVGYFRRAPERARVVRFTFEPPAKTQLVQGCVPVISPDGERIAFVAIGVEGPPQLWVRSMASLTSQPLPGTEGAASNPFWSPDSRQLGFIARNKLKKIDVSGGLPQPLIDAVAAGAWSRDGTILFVPGPNAGISAIPAAGGEPKPATTLDASRHELNHRHARFLPDGRHFLYLAESAQERVIYVGSLDSTERKRVAAAQSAPIYADARSGPGHLLFLRNGVLLAQPFDPGRLAILADAIQVPEQVRADEGVQVNLAPAVSASQNGVLAYRPASGVAGVQLAWFDRGGRRLKNLGEPGSCTNPALSPDGKKLAVSLGEAPKRDIWIHDLVRETASRFTFDPADESNPTWSPDGSRIAFSSDRKGHKDVYVKSASGAGEEELYFESGENKSVEDWARDGHSLLIYTLGARRGDEWLLAAPGSPGERKLLPLLNSEFNEASGQLSPDGKYVLYSSNESGGRTEVYVQGLAPGKGKWQISSGGGGFPRWAPGGKEIFYLAGRNLMAVEVRSAASSLQVGIPKMLFPARLARSPGRNLYEVAPDGQRFLMIVPVEDATTATPVTVVLNWPAELKK